VKVIKDCPFCGAPPIILEEPGILEQPNRYTIFCSDCCMELVAECNTSQDYIDFIEKWNKRVAVLD